MTIDDQQWQKIVTAILALVTMTIDLGNRVLGWHFGNEQAAAIVGEATAVLTLAGVVFFYGVNATANKAVTQLVAGAWRMGKREAVNPTVEGVPHRVGAIRGVAPTPEQVRRYVEHEAGS